MALMPSSLSLAADAIADFVHGWFQAQGEDVLASVDTPVAAAERAKGANAAHAVNFFFYRVAPSAFHQGLTAGDPLFLRLFCLVTPFPSKAQNASAEADADLRLLGEVIRLFHGQPVLPPKPDAPGANDTVYRVQANLLAPNMEEINHIWTTQGTELPYRLSAAYEFALVPLEPLTHRQPGPPVTSALLQVDPSLANAGSPPASAPRPRPSRLARHPPPTGCRCPPGRRRPPDQPPAGRPRDRHAAPGARRPNRRQGPPVPHLVRCCRHHRRCAGNQRPGGQGRTPRCPRRPPRPPDRQAPDRDAAPHRGGTRRRRRLGAARGAGRHLARGHLRMSPLHEAEWQRVAALVTLAEASRAGEALGEAFQQTLATSAEQVQAARAAGLWEGLAAILEPELYQSLVQLDIDLLALALAAEAVPVLAPRLQALQPHIGTPWPSLGLIQELLLLDQTAEVDLMLARLALPPRCRWAASF